MNVLVVGGAGYIGSHCVRLLAKSGHRPVVVDNLVYGHRQAVPAGVPFHEISLGDEAAVRKVLAELSMDAAACIGCGACAAACPNASAMLFVAAKVSHLALLPQGPPERYELSLIHI